MPLRVSLKNCFGESFPFKVFEFGGLKNAQNYFYKDN